MVLVIADDLSGAAELAGVAAAMGHTAEVQTEVDSETNATVVALDTQSRSLQPQQAAERVARMLKTAQSLEPHWIYKKTDSALRGNIVSELDAASIATGKPRVLFIPANPSKERIIVNGEYFIQGRRINETVFANDPEHPIKHARVADALRVDRGGNQWLPQSIGQSEAASPAGLFIPDIKNATDLRRRVAEVNDQTLPAGAADFFAALLEQRIEPSCPSTFPHHPTKSGRSLFICGSLAAWESGLAKKAESLGIPVLTLQDLANNVSPDWATLLPSNHAVLAIGSAHSQPAECTDSTNPNRLLRELIDASIRIIGKRNPDQLFIEGGATASALFARMNWRTFEVQPTSLVGVGCLKPKGIPQPPILYVKPGSYPWPQTVWQSFRAGIDP